jgi:hypothetical protein
MKYNFLLQTTMVFGHDNCDDEELDMIYNFLLSIDNDIINYYNSNSTIVSYETDLELYIEVLKTTIEIFEEREEYEKCQMLKNKIDEVLIIKKKNNLI